LKKKNFHEGTSSVANEPRDQIAAKLENPVLHLLHVMVTFIAGTAAHIVLRGVQIAKDRARRNRKYQPV
jgi:hypothetical protein